MIDAAGAETDADLPEDFEDGEGASAADAPPEMVRSIEGDGSELRWWPPPGAEESGVDWGRRSHLTSDGKPRIVERHLQVTPEFAGLRLDHFIKAQIPRLSRTKIQHVVQTQLRREPAGEPAASGGASVGSSVGSSVGASAGAATGATSFVESATRPLRSNTSVLAGEHYVISRPARPEPLCPRTFDVIYEDNALLVIDKPAGLPVHASAKFYFNTLTRVMSERFPEEDLQICHRLDRETSGILVVAKGRATSAVVKAAFAQKRVQKTYLAVVHGDPPWPDLLATEEPDARLDAPIRVAGVNDPTPLTGVKMLAGPGGLPSLTLVRVVERAGPYALLRCQPVSGRQHQIRLHLAHAGYPIVGDKLYAHGDELFMAFCDRGITAELARRFVLPRHALHAASIKVPHPRTAETLELAAPLPRDLRALLSPPPQLPLPLATSS